MGPGQCQQVLSKGHVASIQPNLNPLDYFIKSELESKACATSNPILENLKAAFIKALKEIAQIEDLLILVNF